MNKVKFIILPMAFFSLLLGIGGGWLRLGAINRFPLPEASIHHGILMVGSFLGTLISVERVVTTKNRWYWLVPIVNILSMPLLILGYLFIAQIALLLGSIGFLVLMSTIGRKFGLKGHGLMLLGAFFQIVAVVLLILFNSYPMALAGWILFFLLTIVGERLDLTRFLPVSNRAFNVLYASVFLVVVGMSFYHYGTAIVAGLGIVLISGWLFLNDIALINVKKTGSYKFLGSALLGAYFWLFVFGFLLIWNQPGLYAYDALIHSFFIGFVLSMILAHAPIIFPSVLGVPKKPFHQFFYFWLVLLHFSIVTRLYGDFSGDSWFRKLGGVLNGVSFLGYLGNVIILLITQKTKVSYV